ncbi:Ger(x)C family spore germination protein [Cohnella sp. CFH 77786]|uniref:Ger(x)C family spore germination protein n=1 Tax=Cohnella sp. CFH 77786 TaxID=2662265 RepID=UPI001C60FD7C|nr:Ger(x)C family spore germination protein [Cohnella sp. CFH 77786]
MKTKFVVQGTGMLLAISLIAGCWDKREINQLNLLSAAAIDSGVNKKYAITFLWFNPSAPSGGKGAQSPVSSLSYTVEGDTLKEAERELSKISPRIPVFFHLEALVIGNDQAKKGIREIIDRFARDIQLRRSKYLLVAANDGDDILQASTPFEMPGTDIRGIIERSNQSSEYSLINFNDFMTYYSDPDILSFLPMVHAIPSKGIKGSRGKQATDTLKVEGMAIFDKGRMIAKIDGEETRAWLYTQGNIEKGTIVQWIGTENETAVFQTLAQSRKLVFDLTDSPIQVKIHIRTTGVIAEASDTSILMQPKQLQKVEEQLEGAIQKQIEQLIGKSQREKMDILLLGREIRSYHPDKWKELKSTWSNVYASAKFHVTVHVDIKSTGMLRKNISK